MPVAVHRARGFASLVVLACLIPVIPASADLSEADGLLGISAREVAWVVRFPAQGYTLSVQRDRQNGKGHYYMFTNAKTGLNVSFYIEPATGCATAQACRESYWLNRSRVLADAQLIGRFERNGFALPEFITVLRVPEMAGRTLEQHHFSGHFVRDGYWVDMHLSMMPYTPKDRQAFLDFLDAIRIEPKAK
jgi:hypothetical protein